MKITKDRVVDLYVNHGKTTKEISEVAGVSSRQIRNVLRGQDVVLVERRRTNGRRVNINFFKTWTPEMAYVLGFILTDGCVSNKTFSISQKYPEILTHISLVMESNYPISRRPNGKNSLHTLNITRKEMVEDLYRLGIHRKKSLTVEFPEVPDDYLPHFLRGVIDGDGWVQDRGYTVRVTSGSLIFAVQLSEILTHYGFNTRVEKQSGAYRIIISGKEDIKRLADWLYADAGVLYLPRKRKRMETWKNAS